MSILMVDGQSPPTENVTPRVRAAVEADERFLLTMLYYAAHGDAEPGRRPEDFLAIPALARYVVGFGRAQGDLGVIAEAASGPAGAAWVRLLAGDERGYGWVDDAIPELAIAVAPDAAGAGIGSRMITDLLDRARQVVPGVSLSVRTDNPARRLYARFGFTSVSEVKNRVGGTSETMVLRFR
jgi:ribosomal protein S18 acetylase RimI-like enzyme